MLKGLTSLWDYFNKCKEDKAYEEVAIRGHIRDTCNQSPHNFETAKAWLERWVIGNVKEGYEETCNGMVNYLNQQIKQINNDAYSNEIARRAMEFEARRQGQTIQEAIETQRQQAQMTGQPVITAQQTPPAYTDWITTTAFTIQHNPIIANFNGTITIDNQGAHVNNANNPPNYREPAPPGPHVENLWGDITEPPGHPDNPVGQAPIFTPPTGRPLQPGDMTEYGWFDQEIENEINAIRATTGIAREDAIIRVFNDAGPDHTLRNPPPPTPPAENEPQWVDLGDDFCLDDFIIDNYTYSDDDPREER